MSFFKKAQAVLGMNARNLLYIQKYNSKADKKFADNKLFAKNFLESRGISVPKSYAVIHNYKELDNFNFEILPKSFVIKPNHGSGGEGIIIVQEKKGRSYKLVTGEVLDQEEIYLHLAAILDGKYALSGTHDQVIIEEQIFPHEVFKPFLSVEGLPDIRIIVFRFVPVMAMLRLPTQESAGKGNLALGAVGIGIDIATGKMTNAYHKGKLVRRLPNGQEFRGIEIPEWDTILLMASKIQQVSNMGYVGVDLVLTPNGVRVLEVNARPGLKIQLCNRIPLRERLERINEYKVLNSEHGVEVCKRLFSQSWKDIRSSTEKPIIGLKEPILVFSEGVQVLNAKIDPHASENLVSSNLPIEEGLLDVNIQGKRVRLPFKKAPLEEYDAIIGGRFLTDFLIDVSVQNAITQRHLEDIHSKMLANLDRKLAEIDEQINLLSFLKPRNLKEIQSIFLVHQNFHPQFQYKEVFEGNLLDLEKELSKLPKEIDHILMPLYLKKIDEVLLKIQLVRARNSSEFTAISEKLYGAVSESTFQEALYRVKSYEHVEESFVGKKLSGPEVFKNIEALLKERKLDSWKLELLENMNSNMSVSKRGIIFINKDLEITEQHLAELILHEVETHVFRAENSKYQKYRLFERGVPQYLETEEGLAMWAQHKVGKRGEKEVWAALRVVAVYLGKRMGFLELFLELKTLFPFLREDTLWKSCVKVKRGFKDTSIPGCFTKDAIYFTGEKKIAEFMKTASREDVALLYAGKFSLESLPIVQQVDVTKAKFLPSWIGEFDLLQ